jgi:hypothetical protein
VRATVQHRAVTMVILTIPPAPAPILVDAGALEPIPVTAATQTRHLHLRVATVIIAVPPMVGTTDPGLTPVVRIITTTVAAPVVARRVTRHPPRSRTVVRRAGQRIRTIRPQAGVAAEATTPLRRMPVVRRTGPIQPLAIRLRRAAIHSRAKVIRNQVIRPQAGVAIAHQVRRAIVLQAPQVTVRLVSHREVVAEALAVAVVAADHVAHGK